MVGGYAGWSSPTHILAAREDLHWGGPELRGKTRAFQNCCGGSGTHAFFIAWKNAARFLGGTLSVHLHIDKLLPQAEIRCYQPYKGLLTIELKQACKVRVRIPEFVAPAEIKAKSNRGEIQATVWGNYLELGDRPAGEMIEVTYPLPVREEADHDRQSGLPAIPLPRDLEGRHGRADDAAGRASPRRATPISTRSRSRSSTATTAPAASTNATTCSKSADPQPAPLHMDDGFFDCWFLR